MKTKQIKVWQFGGELSWGVNPNLDPDAEILFEGNHEEFKNSKWPSELANQSKPLATGLDLIEYIHNTESNLTDSEVIELLGKLNVFFTFLKQSRCNPLSEESLDSVVGSLEPDLTALEYAVVTSIVGNWKNNVRFIK